MKTAISLLLTIVGIIHLLPLAGVLGVERLNLLYGIEITGPDLAILMRHRAVLFGLLGAFLLWSAVRRTLQPLALAGGFASVVSFVWLAETTGGYNAEIGRVVFADWVALGCLVLASVLLLFDRRDTADRKQAAQQD